MSRQDHHKIHQHQSAKTGMLKQKKMLIGGALSIAAVCWVPTAFAWENGFKSLGWDDTTSTVLKQVTDVKPVMGYPMGDANSIRATPKPGIGFLDIQAIKPTRYDFFKDRLVKVSFHVASYHDDSPATAEKAKADYEHIKQQIATGLGVTAKDTYITDPKQPFFACISSEDCGRWASTFKTKDSTVDMVLEQVGEEDTPLTVSITRKLED